MAKVVLTKHSKHANISNMLEKLIEIQKREKLTNKEFAGILGIHEISWFKIKRTKKIGSATKINAVNAYPELAGFLFNSRS